MLFSANFAISNDQVPLTSRTTPFKFRAQIKVKFSLLRREVSIEEDVLAYMVIRGAAKPFSSTDGCLRVGVRGESSKQEARSVDVSRWFTKASATGDNSINA